MPSPRLASGGVAPERCSTRLEGSLPWLGGKQCSSAMLGVLDCCLTVNPISIKALYMCREARRNRLPGTPAD